MRQTGIGAEGRQWLPHVLHVVVSLGGGQLGQVSTINPAT
jgi:hypothetical protein